MNVHILKLFTSGKSKRSERMIFTNKITRSQKTWKRLKNEINTLSRLGLYNNH